MQPDITHYYGRKVVDIVEDDPFDDAGWTLVLEGGVRIVNEDEDYEAPDAELIKGQALQMAILSSDTTRLYFGTDDNPRSTVMNLNPTKYGIKDDTYEGGQLVRPQVESDEEPAALEPSAPGERVVEGPDAEGEAARSARDPEYTPDDEEDE